MLRKNLDNSFIEESDDNKDPNESFVPENSPKKSLDVSKEIIDNTLEKKGKKKKPKKPRKKNKNKKKKTDDETEEEETEETEEEKKIASEKKNKRKKRKVEKEKLPTQINFLQIAKDNSNNFEKINEVQEKQSEIIIEEEKNEILIEKTKQKPKKKQEKKKLDEKKNKENNLNLNYKKLVKKNEEYEDFIKKV
jgi:hypothetical protein